jgi:hypothetical protein
VHHRLIPPLFPAGVSYIAEMTVSVVSVTAPPTIASAVPVISATPAMMPAPTRISVTVAAIIVAVIHCAMAERWVYGAALQDQHKPQKNGYNYFFLHTLLQLN